MHGIRRNNLARFFLLLLLLQHGLMSLAMATPLAVASGDGAAMTHSCATMDHAYKSGDSRDSAHAGAQGMQQHDHNDCIQAGCDDCVACVACMTAYRNPVSIYTTRQAAAQFIALWIPNVLPDLLYRPPILS